VDARVEEDAPRAHLEFEVIHRVRLSRGEEHLDRLLLPEGIVAPGERPPGVAVDALETDVERRVVPGHADDGRLLRRGSILRTDERRQRWDLVPGPGGRHARDLPAGELHGA